MTMTLALLLTLFAITIATVAFFKNPKQINTIILPQRKLKIKKYKSKDGQFYFTIVATNGEVIAQSEMYINKLDNMNPAIKSLCTLEYEVEELI